MIELNKQCKIVLYNVFSIYRKNIDIFLEFDSLSVTRFILYICTYVFSILSQTKEKKENLSKTGEF